MPDVVVVIPTRGRPGRLKSALDSVSRQTLPPLRTLVVGEDPSDWEGCVGPGVEVLTNSRAHNISGAVNTAISFLVGTEADSGSTFVALLDDDDSWEVSYLAKTLAAAEREALDLVYAGIIRHEKPDDLGVRLSIPQRLSISLFLAGNPHVQGSNMVVRLSALLRAGGFDERLPSTTDRDLCIRLLDLGDLRSGAVEEFLVHHWATDHERLSTPGSRRKAEGLQAFYEKHGPRMSAAERAAFLDRARVRFSWEPTPASRGRRDDSIAAPRGLPLADRPHEPIEFVIGFTVTWVESAATLLADIAELSKAIGGISRVIVCDNSADPHTLVREIEETIAKGVPTHLITRETIDSDASSGRLGAYYVPKARRSGIAFGRTALHHYLYNETRDLRHAAYWILDDDVRLDEIWLGDSARAVVGKALIEAFARFRQQYDVAVGSISGDPPVPAGSLVRTQLLDLWHALLAIQNPAHCWTTEEVETRRARLRQEFPDYYYDLSMRHHGHLETPFPWLAHGRSTSHADALRALLRKASRIAGGIGVFRPVEVGHHTATAGPSSTPVRGGNTLVFDRECLKTFPNVAPRLGDVDLRRGDTVWCMLTARVGGLKVHHREKRVGSIPLFLRQERKGFDPERLTLKPVLADIFGGAFMRVMEEAVRGRLARLGPSPTPREVFQLSEGDRGEAIRRFEELVAQRATVFQLNAWRVYGLAGAILRRLEETRRGHDEQGEAVRDEGEALLAMLRTLQGKFSPKAAADLAMRAMTYPRHDLEDFLAAYGDHRSSYARNLPVVADASDLQASRRFLEHNLGARNLELIGEGAEGLVFSDGARAYKYFHHGIAHFEPGQLDFMREAFAPVREWRRLVALERVVVLEGRVVFVRPAIPGTTYQGGCLADLRELVQECRQQRIVLTNLAPDNFVVGPQGLKYVDLGISVEAFTDASFLRMCRRAYLVYRWHFRKDLKALSTQSLHDDSMPELFGFRHFLATLEERVVEEVVDPPLLGLVRERGARTVFDYGCGNGRLARKIAARGATVVGYDIDESAYAARDAALGVAYLDRGALRETLDTGPRFDLVLCNLVLCTIEDEAELGRVLGDLRRLVSDDGRVVVGVCNPFAVDTSESETHVRPTRDDAPGYNERFSYTERVKPDRSARTEVHRPLSHYIRAFRNAALEPEGIEELPATDFDRLCPCSDFMLFTLRPLKVPPSGSVSLMIKASAMEWRTIGMQVRHLTDQLEGPQRFVEKIVVTDEHTGRFARQYAEPSWDALLRELRSLVEEGIIDRIVVAPTDPATVGKTFHRWFGLGVEDPRCENGQPTFTAVFGIDQCRGEYVLQVDSDCLIGRHDRDHDYLGLMLRVFDQDPRAVTVALPSAMRTGSPYTPTGPRGKWRTEVRCSLLSVSRLAQVLPLPNKREESGRLVQPWHRALDARLAASDWQSYRGGDSRTFFVHVPNDRKRDANGWYNILRAVETGRLPGGQFDKVDLDGSAEEWLGLRREDIVLIVRGRDVPIPRLRRCIDSLLAQRDQSWGVVFIDAASNNGMEEFLSLVASKRLENRVTLYRNLVPVTPIENMDFAVRRLCACEESILVTIDADDALIGEDAIDVVRQAHARGADVTVGSMLATDKERRYPVTFDDPRGKRGGNVWQHLRTFRKRLYDRIPTDHLKVDGDWVGLAEDWAFMLPIVELAENPVWIDRLLYFYEPSADKAGRSRELREGVIAAIIGKPSVRDAA